MHDGLGDPLEHPGGAVGDVDRPAVQGQHGPDVGDLAVADHEEPVGRDVEEAQQLGVLLGGLVRHDLHVGEQLAQAGGPQLALLVDQVALGHQHDPVGAAQRLDGLASAGQELHGAGQQVPTEFQHLRHQVHAVGLDGLEHVERPRLDPEAVGPEVRPLGRRQRCLHLRGVGVRRQQSGDLGLGLVEAVLAAPQRVVAVDPDDLDAVRERPLVAGRPGGGGLSRRHGRPALVAGRRAARRPAAATRPGGGPPAGAPCGPGRPGGPGSRGTAAR